MERRCNRQADRSSIQRKEISVGFVDLRNRIRDTPFWSIEISKSDTQIWRQILFPRVQVFNQFRAQIMDGSDTLIFDDPWIPEWVLKDPLSAHTRLY